jgi:hypothetical protein
MKWFLGLVTMICGISICWMAAVELIPYLLVWLGMSVVCVGAMAPFIGVKAYRVFPKVGPPRTPVGGP